MDQKGYPLKKLVEHVGFHVIHRSADFEDILITTRVLSRPGIQLTDYYNYFDNDRIQIIGIIETSYLKTFSSEKRRQKFEALFASGIPALVLGHNVEILPECMEAAQKYDVTLLRSDRETSELLVAVMTKLNDELAPTCMRHGVFVEVYGEGILLMGESGIGKSEAAIELIKRGHRLVADDAVNIKKRSSTMLIGTAPEIIRNYIELRGIGVVDVRRIFGTGAVKLEEKIDLVMNLENWRDGANYDRMGTDTQFTEILGVKLPCITVPITPGRNLAVIIEVAAMNNRQKRMGYDSAKDFSERIDRYFDSLGTNNA